MIVIDKNGRVKDFLKNMETGIGAVLLDEASFSVSTVNKRELYLVHGKLLDDSALTDRLEEACAIIIFSENEAQIKINPKLKVAGLVTPHTPIDLLKSQLKIISDFCTEKEFLKSQLVVLNAELNSALTNVEKEMLKVKRIYEKTVPRRIENIKGMNFFSRYAAGEHSGGEFFDLFRVGHEALVVASATNSYLASSTLITFFTELKNKKDFSQTSLTEFIKAIEEEVVHINENRSKAITFDLFIGVFDLKKQILNGHTFGGFNLLSDKTDHTKIGNQLAVKLSNIESSSFEIKMDRGERLLLMSPGFLKNWQEGNPKVLFEQLLSNRKIVPTDVIDEMFFQIKRDSESSFLKYDASLIMMEIDQNAMVEI